MNEVWPEIERAAVSQAEAAAMLLLHPPADVNAIQVISVFWQPGDFLRLLKRWDTEIKDGVALLHIPGSSTFSEAMLRTIGAVGGYMIRRTVDVDVLYVEVKP